MYKFIHTSTPGETQVVFCLTECGLSRLFATLATSQDAWCGTSCLFAEIPSSCDRKKEKKATSGETRKIYVHILANHREVPPNQWCVNGGYFCPTIEANFVDVAFKRHGD